MNQLSDARLVALPRHARDDGQVVVAELAAQVPFQEFEPVLFRLAAPVGGSRASTRIGSVRSS